MKIPKSNFSEWYNRIIKEAELCDLRYNVKGFVVFLPYAVKTMKIMYALWEEELERRGHKPALFPALIPEKNLKKEVEHVQGFVPEVFWVTAAGDSKLEEKLAMRPTSETAMYKMYALWIQGLKDLPLKLYQSCQVWRHETKATKPFIRSREFYWIEAHDVFATEKEARDQVREDAEITEEVMHKKMGIPFLFFQRPEWDKFPGAVHTYAADTLMPDGKVLQLPSTHFLGQNFAKAFDLAYTGEDGKKRYAWQTCYGPCISRIYAALFSLHGDEKGLIIPFHLAPLQVVIVPIPKKGEEKKILEYCREIKGKLSAEGMRAEVDESENTPGFKYNYWEMKGVPIRIEIGEKEVSEGAVTIVRRDTGAKEKARKSEIVGRINACAAEIFENLKRRADENFAKGMRSAKTLAELGKALAKGGFVSVPFCSIDMEGKGCADKIKEAYAADMRGILFGKNEKPAKGEKCIACGKEAKVIAYVARQY